MNLYYYGQNQVQTPVVVNAMIPGIFPTIVDRDNYLSSLDTETRDYILQHTDDFRSVKDIADCVEEMKLKR